jgi:hypothetical protein
MKRGKFLEPELYPDHQPDSRNKVPKLFSQVVMKASFVLSLSALHKYNRNCSVCSGRNKPNNLYRICTFLVAAQVFLNDSEVFPLVPITAGITSVSKIHIGLS